MPPRDPLATLARLRKLETDLARQRLAESLGRVAAAEARAIAAAGALRSEQGAGPPVDYAAWLRRGLAERDRAARALALTEARSEQARTGLAGARTAERSLERLREQRREAMADRAERRATLLLDDLASRRR
jgi:flagellar biosynthesis chaperone FliJ